MPKTKRTTAEQPTLSEMRLAIKALRRRIRVAEREAFLKPFIGMIYDARKSGQLLEIEEACRQMIYGKNPDDILEEITVEASKQKASKDCEELSCFQRVLNMYAPIL